MKKINRNLFYATLSFCSILSSSAAYAKIDPAAFKGVTQCFKENKTYLSPTTGFAALDSGLIYNLRFYGNFHPGYRTEKNVEVRDYIKDTDNNDPCWRLLKGLFPSSGGQLTVESTFPTSFGKIIDEPKYIAFLLNFLTAVRSGSFNGPNGLDKQKKEEVDLIHLFLETLSPQAMGTRTQRETLDLFSKLEMVSLTNEHGEYIQKKELETKINILLKNHNLSHLQKQVEKIINTYAAAKVQGSLEDKLINARKASMAFVKDALEKTIQKKETSFKSQFKQETLVPLIESLKEALVQEQNSDYPKGTTEQVLLSFFCYKFNTQEDIWALLRHLDKDIVDHTKIPASTSLFKEEDLERVTQQQNSYTLDDIMSLTMSDIWNQLTPYRVQSTLLGNGNAYKYDRSKDLLLKDKRTFADCQEITLRHLLNIAAYNPVKRTWDLEPVEKHLENTNSNNAYFQNVKKFYGAQPPSLANSGETEIRSLFNRVVGDLNDSKEYTIKYMQETNELGQETNELNAGFINMMRVFEKLFSLPLKSFPNAIEGNPEETFQAKLEWFKDSFKKFFNILNPSRTFQLDSSKLEDTEGEISGTLAVKAKDAQDDKDLFSFNIYSKVNRHAQIFDLKHLKKTQKQDYTLKLQKHPNDIQKGTAEEALWMLSSDPALRDEKITMSLYHLFRSPLQDNDSRIEFLKTLSQLNAKELLFLHDNSVANCESMLKNVLDNISWGDKFICQKATAVIKDLLKIKQLEQTLIGGVKGVNLQNPFEWDSLKNLSNLMYIFSDNLKSETLSVKGLDQLKSLDLSTSTIKEIQGLEDLKCLEDLDLSSTKSLETLSLKGLDQLKSLDLRNSGIKEIQGLEDLKCLEYLHLSSTKSLETLSLKGLDQLKSLDLIASTIKEIQGLEDLKCLERLYLSDKKNLETLSLKGLDQLKSLDLRSSGIKEIQGLEDLKCLEYLHLYSTKSLETLSLKGLDQLKSLDLRSSGIKEIQGLEDLKYLEDLYLCYTENLKAVSLNNFTSLTNLTFKKSNFEHIVFKDLNNLQNLDFSDMKNLKSVVFEGDFPALGLVQFRNSQALESLESIQCTWKENIVFDFKNSGIKNRSQIKGLDLDDDHLIGISS